MPEYSHAAIIVSWSGPTVADLFEDLYLLEQSEGLRIEPSAAAGFRGPRWLFESEVGRQYLENHGLLEMLDDATHILWTTGGAFVPDGEYRQFHERGRVARTGRIRPPNFNGLLATTRHGSQR
jgi:hypothetical protein